jgi:glycerol uptake facilitator protein
MTPFMGEFIGTALLIILGDGVVANVVLNKSKGNNSGWIVITFGWAIAVFVGVYVAAQSSGGHINPAVTLGLAIMEKFPWSDVPLYIGAQMLGAITGAIIVWLAYRQHFNETTDANGKLAVFCTAPAIRSTLNNCITEIIGTFVLVFGVLFMAAPSDASGAAFKLGTLDALPAALLVLGIGLSLGGPTGYAINPARDLGPRIAHFILPIPGKRDSDWGYAWIPVIAPLIGGIVAALIFKLL